MTSYQTTFYSHSDSFTTLADEWRQLIKPNREEQVFLQPEILSAWWECYHPGDLAIVALRKDDALIAIAPLYILQESEKTVLKLIGGDDVIDYLGFILRTGYEEDAVDALLTALIEKIAIPWERLVLQNLPAESWLSRELPKWLEKQGWDFDLSQIEVCPSMEITETYEDYLMALDKKQRHELRRKRRRAEEAGVECQTFTGSEEDLARVVEVFMALMAASAPEKKAFISDETNRTFFHRLARALHRRDQLWLAFLTLKDIPVAAMWQIVTEEAVLLYNSGYDPTVFPELSVGNALFSFCFEESVARGKKKYDFMRGGEEYKLRLGGHPRPLYRLTIERTGRGSYA